MIKNNLAAKEIEKPDGSQTPPPYHTFEVLGEFFVFDTSTVAISKCSHSVIFLILFFVAMVRRFSTIAYKVLLTRELSSRR
jgi:hypothetical protein